MKKFLINKLKLSKETLRALEETKLSAVNGGTGPDCSTSCFTTTCGTIYC